MHATRTVNRVVVLVLIAEPLLSAGVRAVLADDPDLDIVGPCALEDVQGIDVVIASSASVRQMLQTGPGGGRARVLLIAAHADEISYMQAARLNIDAYVLPGTPVYEFRNTVHALALGDCVFDTSSSRHSFASGGRDVLTQREHDVLCLLAIGLCNKSIARQLGIAAGTVKVHVRSIMAKLDASTRTQAASIAAARRMIDPSNREQRRHAAYSSPQRAA